MKIHERYSVARNTSNLAVNPRTSLSASDVLGAAGMAGQEYELALLLWSVLYQGKIQAKVALVNHLSRDLRNQMEQKRWTGDPVVITKEVIGWWFNGVCKSCKGRGYEVLKGTPHLSERLCKACHGAKMVALPRGDTYTWLANRMDTLTAIASGAIMRKLAKQINSL